MTPQRLPPPYGRELAREVPVEFSFEGRRYRGLLGDTVASALAANGVFLLSRSFKYHRPRGPLTMAGQDANTLVQVSADPNALADRTPLRAGLEVVAQNVSGSLARDRGAWVAPFARFLPVAFYYKAFYRPRGMWNIWARFFRRRTGLGVIDPAYVARGYDKQYRFCDVAVVGGGAAGLAAALEAAGAGAEVLLIDDNTSLGGALNYAHLEEEGEATRRQLVDAVRSHEAIEVMTGSTVNGWFADNYLPVIHDKRLHKLRARQVILCPGALEQPAVFRNNDLPGVMLGSAAQRLMRLYAVRPGQRAVVLTANADGYAVARDLHEAGVEVAALVDLRAGADEPWVGRLAQRGIEVVTGHTVFAALAGPGKRHLGGVEIREVVARGRCAAHGRRIKCDLLCVSVGQMPAYQLACMAGARLDYVDADAAFAINDLPQDVHLAGAANARSDLAAALADGRRAARNAARALGLMGGAAEPPGDSVPACNARWPIFAHPRGKEFVDLDEDLTVADILNATREGYEHIELVKRYSTCGMGPSQGRHSALALARLVAEATATTVSATGVTTARPPFAAERLAHCAGRSFYPARRSNMHERHLEAGAQMMLAGDWYRPAFYGPAAERDACIEREAHAVRSGVGLIDVSTLGGIEVRGADATEFMNRVYTSSFAAQSVGRARYALMTSEAGVVIDDGVACRLAEQHYYVTATTGGVARVYQALLKWNAQWRLAVSLANVTSAWCGINIAGPRARSVVATLCDDVDLSAQAFPYMAVREGRVAGIPARLVRVGFVGELGFEIHAPAHCGEALWDALRDSGRRAAIRPVGIEAQRLLRLEKGHIIVGQDTDALSYPTELGMGWTVSHRKPFFVGGRALSVLTARPLTRALVGFVIRDGAAPLPKECQLVIDDGVMVGRVTSVARSPTLGQTIGLAFVPPTSAAPGSGIRIRADGGVLVDAEVVALPFYDPDNERQAL